MLDKKQNVSNWIFPQIKELGAIDKKLIHHKEKLLAEYHHIVDDFFRQLITKEHYAVLLSSNTITNQKVFKSRCLTIYLQLMKILIDNPQRYYNTNTIATCKALIYWHIHLIIKYRGLNKYTNILNNSELMLPSGNDPRFSISKQKLYSLTEKYHDRLFELFERIYKV